MAALTLRFPADEVFTRARELFQRVGFNEDSVEQQAIVDDALLPHYDDGLVPEGSDAAGLLIGLFLRAGKASHARLLAALGEQGFADLTELGLLQTDDAGLVRAPMRIRPMYGMYIVADHWDPTRLTSNSAEDVVMAPDFSSTLEFLSFIPHTPCERFLEACGGAGSAALVAAQRFANRAYCFDLTERSTRCSSFSARLSAVADFEARRGNTYEPAAGLLFDRVVAHPPCVPALRHNWIFYSGGPDGAHITGLHVEKLPDVLAPGGRFYCRAVGNDRLDQPFEERVRGWLGEQHAAFDILLLVFRKESPLEFILPSVSMGHIAVEDVPAWQQEVTRLGIVHFLPFLLVIQRHDQPRQPFTIRRTLDPSAVASGAIEWLLDWETRRAKGEAEDLILTRNLLAAPASQRIRREIQEGEWRVTGHSLHVDAPFVSDTEVDPLAAGLLPACDGQITGHQLVNGLIAQGHIRPDTDPRAFASVLAGLVSAGCLYVEDCAPPLGRRQ